MNTLNTTESPDKIDLFSLSPKNRRKVIEEYVSMCPFLGKYLSESELIALIQNKIEENKKTLAKENSVNLSKMNKKHLFLTHISYFPISERTKTVLDNANYIYLGDICSTKKWKLKKIKGLGIVGMREIQAILDEYHISLGLDKEFWNQIRPNNGENTNSQNKTIGTQLNTSDTVLGLLNGGRH